MSEKAQDTAAAKAALKALRETRKVWITAATAKMKRQKRAIQAICDQLRNSPQTVPEIAAATGASSAETLWYVATLKKYGQVKEVQKDGGYFKYAWIEASKASSAE